MESVELYVIKNNDGPGYLMCTRRGKPVFVLLSVATTYTSMSAVKNAVSRIQSDFNVSYKKARLEVVA